MRIFHVVLPGASEYERKSQRIDFEALRGEHQIVVVDDPQKAASADVAQIYGPPSWPANLPEAVSEEFFGGGQPPTAVLDSGGPLSSTKRVGSFLRQSIIPIVERTIPRLHRTRRVRRPRDRETLRRQDERDRSRNVRSPHWTPSPPLSRRIAGGAGPRWCPLRARRPQTVCRVSSVRTIKTLR